MSEKQKTIQKEFTVRGVGLHTGNKVTVRLKPADVNTGVSFVRVDLDNAPVIRADFTNIVEDAIPRCTSIGKDAATIHTVEHLMSVLCGLGIDNLRVEIDGNEMPGLDGSGQEFLKGIKAVGITEQEDVRPCFYLKEPIWIEEGGATVLALPSFDFRISYFLDYSHAKVKTQYVSVDLDPKTFEEEIAPSRTFCLESEAEELKKSGLGKGANYENTLVITEHGIKHNKVRFDDEFARHKILDFIGDIYLLGMPLKANIFAVRSGHNLNLMLLKKIAEQKRKYPPQKIIPKMTFDPAKAIDINGIMKILPHRYPFLLVDRVVALDVGKKAVGIKNVTTNEIFFQGHFPTRPIMPGVLMVEAMAQVAGIALLTSKELQGKLALFMAADNVKFRKIVAPGDQLVIESEITRIKSKTAQARSTTKANGEIVAEADLMFSFTESSFLET